MSDGHNTLSIAIIGSGPAGYYAAEGLTKASTDDRPIEVDVIDQLPTPFGLIRAGVAPDHQAIKNVAKRYEQTALQDNVHFIGNVSIGRDIQMDELLTLYDAVILAIGAGADRRLDIPGHDLPGVVGSAEFVGWYNSHPDHASLAPSLNIDSIVIIGNGNVAVDVCRVLSKTKEEMASSDLARHAADAIHPTPINKVWMFGRRGPMDAKFTPKELSELGELSQCNPITLAEQLPDTIPDDIPPKEQGPKKKILTMLQDYSKREPCKTQCLNIRFYAAPVAILGTDRVEGIRMEETMVDNGRTKGTGHFFDIACQMVIPCIGYRTVPIEGVPFDKERGRFRNENGKVKDGLYVTGWARRGPTGTIGTNRPDALEVVEKLLTEVSPSNKAGRRGLEALFKERGVNFVTFRDWQKINQAELSAAQETAPRHKFAHLDELLAAARTV